MPNQQIRTESGNIWDSRISASISADLRKVELCSGGAFICYAHEDSNLVLPWVRSMLNQGYPVFYDNGGTTKGLWYPAFVRTINACQGLVYVVSPRSVSSTNCLMELQHAWRTGKDVLFIDLNTLGCPHEPYPERTVANP